MAKAKRDRRTSIRNLGVGDDALAALERLEALEQQHQATHPVADDQQPASPRDRDDEGGA